MKSILNTKLCLALLLSVQATNCSDDSKEKPEITPVPEVIPDGETAKLPIPAAQCEAEGKKLNETGGSCILPEEEVDLEEKEDRTQDAKEPEEPKLTEEDCAEEGKELNETGDACLVINGGWSEWQATGECEDLAKVETRSCTVTECEGDLKTRLVGHCANNFEDLKALLSLDSPPSDIKINFANMRQLYLNVIQGIDPNFEKVTVSDWDVSSVTNMMRAFWGAKNFNQPLNWDVSNVQNMNGMFLNATAFDQALNHWNVSSVVDMASMFEGTPFNHPLHQWNVSSVKWMENMFRRAKFFNQNINSWTVNNVTDMHHMFHGANAFNQPLDRWIVSNVENMSYMFSSADSFNQPLNDWTVTSVTDMSSMFRFAGSFNQSLEGWDVSGVKDMRLMFDGSGMVRLPTWHK